ncbi:hypothetical protein BKA70DRAFT_1494807 [Coprinopsis sp. MPI-PUGE-AT-0042]|nr:hypothetical protein BKA70DRAFT_1494807 [Coprinopsis sp. MPI-PUGE-AT-0042]
MSLSWASGSSIGLPLSKSTSIVLLDEASLIPPFSPEEEAAIEAACKAHNATHLCRNNCLPFGPYIVKYGDPQSNKPRIPQLIHHFDNGQGTSFVILEAIKLLEAPPDLDKRIVDTVAWLAGVPAPSGHKLGPLGGGFIRHYFFLSDEVALLPFVNVEALERYLEKGRKVLCRGGYGVDPVRLKGERLVCVHAGVDDRGHFGVDEAGNTVMMGLGNVSFLPESFARLQLRSEELTASLPESLGLAGATNQLSMAKIASVLGMIYDPTLAPEKDEARRIPLVPAILQAW